MLTKVAWPKNSLSRSDGQVKVLSQKEMEGNGQTTHMIFRQLDDRRDSKDFIDGLVFIDVTIVIVVTLSDNRTDVTLPKLKIALKRHLVTKILRRPR